MLNTIKRQRLFNGFWILWDIVWFVKNLIEGDVVYMIVFAVLACLQLGAYFYGVKTLRARQALEAKITAEKEEWYRKLETI